MSLHLRLSPETRNSLGRKELALIKPTAILVNTGRGALVDRDALLAALKDRKIFGAGPDVFHQEPLAPDDPILALPNVVCSPHTAGQTPEVIRDGLLRAVENVEHFLKGSPETWSCLRIASPARLRLAPAPLTSRPRKERSAVECLAHFVSQTRQGERFRDQRISGDRPVVIEELGCKGGHEEHLRLALDRAQQVGELPPVHPGHDDIGQQQMNRSSVSLGDPQRVFSVRRLEDMVAFSRKDIPRQGEYPRVVIHHEDGFPGQASFQPSRLPECPIWTHVCRCLAIHDLRAHVPPGPPRVRPGQDFPHLPGEHVRRKGLLEKGRARIQDAVTNDRFVNAAGLGGGHMIEGQWPVSSEQGDASGGPFSRSRRIRCLRRFPLNPVVENGRSCPQNASGAKPPSVGGWAQRLSPTSAGIPDMDPFSLPSYAAE